MAIANDKLDGTAGSDLSAHTADSGHTWTYMTGTNAVKLSGLADGSVYSNNASVEQGQYKSSWTPASANYNVIGRLHVVTAGSAAAVQGHLTGTTYAGRSGYQLRAATGTNLWRLQKVSAGVETDLATVAHTFAADERAEMVLEIATVGSNVELRGYVDGTQVVPSGSSPHVDTAPGATFTGAGAAGLSIGGIGSATTGAHFERWQAADAGDAWKYTLSGPSTSTAGVPSSDFTADPNGNTTVTITPASTDLSPGDTFAPTSLSWSGTGEAKTFTCTAGDAGARTISTTNDAGLIDPAGLTLTASGGGAAGPLLAGRRNRLILA